MPASQSYTSEGSKTATSDPFSLDGKKYNTKVETTIKDGNVKSSAITLQKEVTTRSGKDYQGYATSYDGGKTWYEPGVKPLKKISTSSGLTAAEIKSLQPGGALNKEIVKSSQLAAKKNDATPTQLNQLKNGNDATVSPSKDPESANREAVEKELEKIEERKKYDPLLKYPENIQLEYQDCIKFSMLKYQQSFLGLGADATRKQLGQVSRTVSVIDGIPKVGIRTPLTTIVLPIPGGISDSNTVEWQGNPLDEITNAFAGMAMGGIQGGAPGLINAAERTSTNVQSNVEGYQKFAASKLTELAVGTSGIMQRQFGAVTNPNLELLFNGPQLRSFSFTFKLSPRSESEAIMVKKIIRYFKQGMTPKRSSGYLLLQSPHTFAISYLTSNKQHPYLNKFKECALTQCNVNYTPEGNYMSFDGTERSMTSYELTLQFQELIPLFDDDYGSEDTDIGF